MVVGSSLAHHVALLVPLSGSIDPVVDRRGFTGLQQKIACKSRPGHL